MTIIIGLLGPAGAGKSSVAQHLVDNYNATRYSLAKPLKDFAMNALDLTHEQCWGTQAQKEAPDGRYGGKSARWFLQKLGTEGGRKTFGEDFWTKQCLAMIKREKPALAVIEDVRFVSEAEAIRAMQHMIDVDESAQCGFIWLLKSPGREQATSEAQSTHASEQEWMRAPTDWTIEPAERGLPQLFKLVDATCRAFKLFPKRPELPL